MNWRCLNCDAVRSLDVHGRCEVCGSDAVTARFSERGFALLLEMVIVCTILLVLAAMAVPNFVQMRAGINQGEARTKVLMVYNAQAAATVCSSTPGCENSPALLALVPTAGSVVSSGYRFTFVEGWSYTAAPINEGSGHSTYTAAPSGFTCTGVVPCS